MTQVKSNIYDTTELEIVLGSKIKKRTGKKREREKKRREKETGSTGRKEGSKSLPASPPEGGSRATKPRWAYFDLSR